MRILLAAVPLVLFPYGPCDLKKLEPAPWCEKCDKVREKAEIKEGRCAVEGCDTKLKKIELCVRALFVCACGGDGCCRVEQEKPGKCRCGVPLADKSDRARVLWVCEGCEAKHPVKDEVKHDAEKHKDPAVKNTLKKTCEKSGRGVHFGK